MTEYNLENPIEAIKFFLINPEVKLLRRTGIHYLGRRNKIQIKPICYERVGLYDYSNRYSNPPNIVIGEGYWWYMLEQNAPHTILNPEALLLQLERERND